MFSTGETCVHVAARAGDKEILQHLTSYGADINAKVSQQLQHAESSETTLLTVLDSL